MNDQTRSASDYNSGATDDMHGLVGAYALNAVSETERTAFEAHLDVCGQCREELASFGSVIDSLADDADGDADVVLPAGLAERIAAEIAVTEQVHTLTRTVARKRRRYGRFAEDRGRDRYRSHL